MRRHLSQDERKVLYAFAHALAHQEKAQLLNDIENCFITQENEDYSLIQFGISGYERPPYQGQHTYAAEGELRDKDGAKLTALLFADEHNRLLELELIRWSGKDEAIIEPQWESFIIQS